MSAPRWTSADMPDLTGRTAVVTGANSGLGLETAAELAAHGASVTLAVRDTAKGEAAAAEIRRRAPHGQAAVMRLDLADLASVSEFATAWAKDHPAGLDLLVNNAGIMAIPRQTTVDGFERQFGTNHLGHFALTGHLLPSLRDGARVVTVSSQAHRMGRLNLDDLMGSRSYGAWSAYGQSKLANLLFTFELQRRLERAGLGMSAMAAHPGYAATNLQNAGPEATGSRVGAAVASLGSRILAQSAAMGALPTLYAATVTPLPGGTYVGPGGLGEQRGHPKVVGCTAAARDPQAAARLWEASEQLTGVDYLS